MLGTLSVWMPMEAVRGSWIPPSWSYRWSGATRSGYWELDWGPLEEKLWFPWIISTVLNIYTSKDHTSFTEFWLKLGLPWRNEDVLGGLTVLILCIISGLGYRPYPLDIVQRLYILVMASNSDELHCFFLCLEEGFAAFALLILLVSCRAFAFVITHIPSLEPVGVASRSVDREALSGNCICLLHGIISPLRWLES